MNATEQYLFDVQGYLVVPGFLPAAEVDALNAALDANRKRMGEDGNSNIGKAKHLAGRKRGMFSGMLAWPKPWCQPFRDLLAHPRIVPYLDAIHGRGWRMDHSPFLLHSTAGSEGLILHSGGGGFDGVQYHQFHNGRIRCGMVVMQYQLADVNPGDGGFCCVPGSHKANLPITAEIRDRPHPAVTEVPCRKGDLLIFNEVTAHGTLPWRGKGERRSLLYRYSPKHLNFAYGYGEWKLPKWTRELTEAQRAVLEPPYIYHHPLIEADGVTVVKPWRE
jgi:ectoine hydroxylase-related dioxygenase (phytanoyl-CoA dioxygenase family)